MHVVDQALRSKVDLSPDSIRAKYAAEISKANATYSELDSAAEGKVNAVMMLLGTPEEIQLLSTFFGDSAVMALNLFGIKSKKKSIIIRHYTKRPV